MASSLLLVLAVVPSLAFQAPGRAGPQVPRGSSALRPQKDLRLYLATAAHYGSGYRTAALREIRQWGLREIAGATAALRQNEKHLRSEVKYPDEIDFHTVEAAVLMHAQAGILFLQEQKLRPAKVHLDASSELLQWSRRAAKDRRNWTTMRRYAFKDRPPDPALELTESINARDFYVALASAALALGYAEAAGPFAAQARSRGSARLRGPARAGLRGVRPGHGEGPPAPRLGRGTCAQGCGEGVPRRPRRRSADARGAAASRQAAPRHEPRDRGRAAAGRGRREGHDRAPALPRPSLPGPGRRAQRDAPRTRSARTGVPSRPGPTARPRGSRWLTRSRSRPGPAPPARSSARSSIRPLGRTSPSDPWFLYPIGPPGLAQAAFNRVWERRPSGG